MSTDEVVLRALTPEAEDALGGSSEVPIRAYPFRVGRESKDETSVLGFRAPDRTLMIRDVKNQLHLRDTGELKTISREHFQIEQDPQGGYVLKDRGSVCGTVVGGNLIGGGRKGGTCPLLDGSVIVVGGPESPYAFRFIIAREPRFKG